MAITRDIFSIPWRCEKEIRVIWHMKSFQMEYQKSDSYQIAEAKESLCHSCSPNSVYWFGCHANILHIKFNIISHLLVLLRCHVIFLCLKWQCYRYVCTNIHMAYDTTAPAHPSFRSIRRRRIEYEKRIRCYCVPYIKCLFQFSSFNNSR